MLKEILKIDGSDAENKNEVKLLINEVPASSYRQDSHGPASQHRQAKKIGRYME